MLNRPDRAPLLATKLFVPRARQNLVSRPRLVERLNEGLHQRLTLVSAPAGFGKTTLVGYWAQAIGIPVAWLSLDEADNDPSRFLNYLFAGLRQIDSTIGQDLQGALAASSPPRMGALVGALINDLAVLPADYVLIIDDFHVIDEATIHEAIQELVAHQPPQMHLVIVTREDPPLPLSRLRASGHLVELRAADLRFVPEETVVFLNEIMGLALDGHEIHELDERVEGWVAGLQLASLSLQGRQRPAELIAALSGSHHFILSYLTEEVLRQQSPEIQSFLLETSVLARLTGPLCEAVTGRPNGDALLEQLYTSNAFVIPLDEGHTWYRYHHLFADLLRNQLKRGQPQLVPTLHIRASEWHEAHGNATEAIEHAFAAEDYERVVRLLEAHAMPVTLQGFAQTVENWLRRLPQKWRKAGPRANLAFGWSLLLRGQLAEVEACLQNAETAANECRESGADAEAGAILSEACSMRSVLSSIRGDIESGLELASQALSLAPQRDSYLQGLAHFALGSTYLYGGKIVKAIAAYRVALPLCQAAGNAAATDLIIANLALLHITQGQLHAAAEICRQSIDAAELPGGLRLPALATVYIHYGTVRYEWGELDAAYVLTEKGLEVGRRGGHIAGIAFGNVVQSRLFQMKGDLTRAESALNLAAETLRHGVPDWVGPRVVAQQVALALARDDDVGAAQILAEAGVRVDDPVSDQRELLHIAYLHLLHHQGCKTPRAGHLEQALDLADRLLAAAEAADRGGRQIEILAMRALIHQALGDTDRALDDLSRALALGEPQGYMRLFVAEGLPMARLLRAALQRGHRPPYVTKLLVALSDRPDAAFPPPSGLIEPLTERELEVLCLLADDLTYEEIAQRLVVSLNTVRYHVRGLYGKLGVEKRAAAIARARVLRLI